MTALDDWIQEISQGTYSSNPQNLISRTKTAILALQYLGGGGGTPCPLNLSCAGTANAPVITMGGDTTTGFYRSAADNIGVSLAGALQFAFDGTGNFSAANAAGPRIINSAPSATAPILLPNKSNVRAGIGANAAGNVSLIADNAGVATEAIRVQAGGNGQFLLGTTNNSNAPAGYVGEVLSASVASGVPVPVFNVTAKTIVALVLTPGDWDVRGQLGELLAGTTVQTRIDIGLNTAPNAQPGTPGDNNYVQYPFQVTGNNPVLLVGPSRFNVSVNTTVYLVATATFSVSTVSCYGQITARRIR